MPFVTIIGGETRDRAIALAKKARAKDANPFDSGLYYGFMDGLRACLPSESVGMLVMDIDLVLDGEEPYTDLLPRLVVGVGGV